MAHTEAHTEAMGSDLNTDPNILESSPSPYDTARHHNSELKQSISAWKQRAKSARKDADKAEAQAQWENWDYYVDLAELCEEMAWNTQIQMDTRTGTT